MSDAAGRSGQGPQAELVGLIERIGGLSLQSGRRAIQSQTRIYHDLFVAGDDAFELVEEIHLRFGTNLSAMAFSEYFPDETDATPYYWAAKLFGYSGRRFKVLTFQHLAAVVARGHWFEPAPQQGLDKPGSSGSPEALSPAGRPCAGRRRSAGFPPG